MTAGHTVLFVDDEVEILESLRSTVRHEPYDVVTTTSPIEALSRIDAINQGEVYRYLTKPWEASELRDVLREALARLDELRRGALASRHEQVEQMLRTELAAQHPGILTPPPPDGIHTLDLDRLMGLLLQIHAPLLNVPEDDRETAAWAERTTTPGSDASGRRSGD